MSQHHTLRIAIEKAARSIQDDIQYSFGRDSDLNQDGIAKFLIVNVNPPIANASFAVDAVTNYSKSWSIAMAFGMMDTDEDRYYETILDKTDAHIDRFINNLNLVDTIVLSSINQTPFIKGYANVLTGHILTFTATVTDDFDYCNDC